MIASSKRLGQVVHFLYHEFQDLSLLRDALAFDRLMCRRSAILSSDMGWAFDVSENISRRVEEV